MRFVDVTLESAAENVALDEALLDVAEHAAAEAEPVAGQAEPVHEWLRIWEPASPVVVVGRSSSVAGEVDFPACQADGVPVLRRSSGGATIVAAPGCLMYAVVLSNQLRPQLAAIDQAHELVLGRIAGALAAAVPELSRAGVSDLAIDGRKVSGNSLRCRRTHLLYHGTLLYDMDLSLVSRYLRMPARQPDYRDGRAHDEFLTNMPIERSQILGNIHKAWGHPPLAESWPRSVVDRLLEEKYSRADWNHRVE